MRPVHSTWGGAVVALTLGFAALPAAAQQSGTYRGTTSQGQSIRLTVSDAPAGGLEVTVIEAAYALTCEIDGQPVWLASTVSGAFPLDAAGHFDASYLWDRDFFRTTGGFTGASQMAGDTTWSIAAVTRYGQHVAEVCAAPVSTWTASSPGAVASQPAPTGVARWQLEVHLARDGQILSRELRLVSSPSAGERP